jgi:hypothetical protein
MRKTKIRKQRKERLKSNSSVKETKFLNISRIESESVNGYQVKYSVNKHEYQPFFGFSDKDALKKCLQARNALYREYGFPRSILLKEIPINKRSSKSSTGWHGIYDREEVDYRRGTSVSVISVSIRNLETAKPTNRSFRKAHYKSDRACLNAAKRFRKNNLTKYNAIVRRYNDSVVQEAEHLMEEEVRTLKPCLNHLKGLDLDRWNKAYAQELEESEEG